MQNKSMAIFLFSIFIIFFSCLENNSKDEISRKNLIEKIKFEVIDFKSNEPVKNEVIYFLKDTSRWTHSIAPMKIIDSVKTNENGFFTVSENILNQNLTTISFKDRQKKLERYGELSTVRYRPNERTITVTKEIDGYGLVFGNSIYNLKTKKVIHKNFRKDTTITDFQRIKLVRYTSQKRYFDVNNFVINLIKENYSEQENLEKIWNYCQLELKTPLKEQDKIQFYDKLFNSKIKSAYSRLLFHKEKKLDVESIFSSIDESTEVKKKYYFLHLLSTLISYKFVYNKEEIDEIEIERLFVKVREFYKANPLFIKEIKKIENYHCHDLKKLTGEILIQLEHYNFPENGMNAAIQECCKKGI